MRLQKLNCYCLFNKNDNFCLLFSLLPPSFLQFLCGLLLLLLLFLGAASFKEATDRNWIRNWIEKRHGIRTIQTQSPVHKMLQVSLCGDEGKEETEKHGFPLPMPLCPLGSPCLLQERPHCLEAAVDHCMGSSLWHSMFLEIT